ncbi:MAG: YdbL family protein [Alphaproteobacteria bacterium]|nr:YdbL family protein [Alphaproteobacteria bacterium]
MKFRYISLLAIGAALLALPAWALDLQEARRQGIIGEKLDGFAVVLKPSPEANVLVADINAKRQQEYARISRQNNQPVNIIARLAAREIINHLSPGSPYQAPDGSWMKR